MKDISIIIPYFRKRKYILKTIESIKRQTFKNYEVIIIYDDEYLSDFLYLKKKIKNYKNFFLYKNKKNLGAGLSRNLGIQKSNGKYIAFLDADDYWNKNKLKYQYSFMVKNKYLVTHTDYYLIDDKKQTKSKRIAKCLDFQNLIKSCDIGLSTVMIKKSILSKIKFPNLQTKEDYVFWLKLLKKNNLKVYPLNITLTYWRKTDGSLSSNFFQKIKDAFLVYNKYCNFNFIKSFVFVIILSINAMKKKIYD